MRTALVATMLASVTGCTGTAAVPATPASGPDWRRLPPAPSQRTEVAAAATGSRIVVVGGYHADGSTVPTTEIVDTAAGTWQRGPDLPVAVNHAMAATVAGAVHVFGGHLADRRPGTGAYRLDGTTWRPVAPLPEGRAAGTAVAQDGLVYLAGGVGPAGLARTTLIYDPATNAWSSAPGPPTPREHLGGAGFGGLVYTVGGRTGGLDTNLAAFEVFDPRTRRWAALPDLPTRRGSLAATATCAGRIVAVGGEAEATFAEAEAFDARTGTWQALAPLPTPRHGLGVVAIGDTVYTLAGGPRPGLHVADTVEALDLTARAPATAECPGCSPPAGTC